MVTSKMLEYQLYVQRENNFLHEPLEKEYSFYTAVKNGDVEYIEKLKKNSVNSKPSPKGHLSSNPLRNEIYHFVVNTAIIVRCCVDGGMPHETAYTLSDLYINQADKLKTPSEVFELNDRMVMDYAKRMKELHYSRQYSQNVYTCIHYIYNNLHQDITVKILAELTGLNPNYLSTHFKKETGWSISRFIINTRLDTAAKMLESTQFSCSDIAFTLNFSSQSYFIRQFRSKFGITPNEYRKRNYSVFFSRF